jgi:hypothetical protein
MPESEPKKIRIPEDIPTTKTDLTNQTTQTLDSKLPLLLTTEAKTITETSASKIPIAKREEFCASREPPEAHPMGRIGPIS